MKEAKDNGQNCLDCENCDGFACIEFDVWLDGTVEPSTFGGSRSAVAISVEEYGEKYCRRFIRRAENLGLSIRDFPFSIGGDMTVKIR